MSYERCDSSSGSVSDRTSPRRLPTLRMLLVALANLVFAVEPIEGVGMRDGGFVDASGFMDTGGLELLRLLVMGKLLKVRLFGKAGNGSSDTAM
jgi:hypothetical protein